MILGGTAGMTEEDRSLVGRLHLDVPLLLGLLSLAGIGMVVLYSAGGENTQLVARQGFRLGVAFAVMFVVAQVSPRLLFHWAPWLYALGLGLLVAVLLVGDIQQGAQRWLRLGRLNFQPSELAKITVPLMVAYYLAERSLPPRLLPILAGGVLAIVPTLLIAKQPDLGTALLICASGIFVLFLAGMSWVLIGVPK